MRQKYAKSGLPQNRSRQKSITKINFQKSIPKNSKNRSRLATKIVLAWPRSQSDFVGLRRKRRPGKICLARALNIP